MPKKGIKMIHQETKMKEARAIRAYEHAKEILKMYDEIGSAGALGGLMIRKDIGLYEKGDRSEALIKSLEDTE